MLIRNCAGTPHYPLHVTLRCDVSSFVVYFSTCEVIRVNTLMVIQETPSPTPAAAGRSSSIMISADGMSLLEVHTDRAAGQRDIEIAEEEPPREMEDDLGLPTPSI